MKIIYLQILKSYQSNKGFTLIELVIAMALTLVVVTVAGTGLINIITADQQAQTRNNRNINLDRALDFIGDEIRNAKSVNAVPAGSSFPGSGTGVILLTIPPATSPTRVYFVRTNTNIASGPMTINRASDPYSTTSAITVSSGDMLVDGISDPPASSTNPTVNTAPNTTSDCPSSVGTLTGGNGFYACIYTNNRKVDLYLYGKLSDAKDNNNKYTNTYKVKTTVFARAQ